MAGITARLRARKARRDAAYARTVRPQVDERDGYCRYGKDRGDWRECRGASEWAHIGEKQRFKTRGLPPAERHTTTHSMMLCVQHHDDYDDGRIAIVPLTDAGCDGPVRWERKAA